ncbi:TIGR02587 family membrane protein [Promicromonospora iranensis]|uniref:Integral membrane protein (TIGR02587 family) n=1 Tax=Promicromonospora iranensis TaxID=1105144 RepID=A0ABU2CHK3_9MICO|nr:TIGR02587 family membrane protein [Promicromonospora iranensis]MDR7380794.1 putative integral membrane protein (TIGR02587 family) [Promicromonospora iranensis]
MNADTSRLVKGLGRAFGGALLFALPLFMTMEIWRLAAGMDRWRLLLLYLLTIVLAFTMERHLGLRQGEPDSPLASVVDTAIALTAGIAAAAVVLSIFAVLEPVAAWGEAVAVVALAALPATIGASFARSQLGLDSTGRASEGYRQELFLMTAGATVFAANVAPTEEVVLLAGAMEPGHALGLIALELVVMHAFVYAVEFKGGATSHDFARVLLPYTVVGYVIACAVSAYLLWSFGRFDGTALGPALIETLVLALPATIGAAAARLIV